jgi:hypothetical protein
VRLTASAICGTDLHMIRGACPAWCPEPPWDTREWAWWRMWVPRCAT